MKQCISFWLGIVAMGLLGACGGSGTDQIAGRANPADTEITTITVATAANVQFAMEELIQAFEAVHPKVKVETVVSSSGKLSAQILEGAPYDLLISANMKYPEYLLEQKVAVGGAKVYAYGILVAWSLTGNQVRFTPEYLLGKKVGKVAVANPRNAPYGLQAINYLKHYGVFEAVEPKLVYGESIAQTNQYITSEAVDVGLTAKSVVLSPDMKGKGRWLELPVDSYNPIEQGVVMTEYGQAHHPRASLFFYTFLFSDAAAAIFEQYGYQLPDQNQ